ncbi:hypothetical protein LPW26_12405 [Rhodopseudomonas sp. HC1]|uniref:hypothetical protein n=1 Tax=Rhodopseudomonas infernalis TaxID=2897386 RepID=UPI001EE8282E|nr:hypothetical protein [Rhodopseudomonas infernalis]MCG6205445.1 hypothetical protein [Rhodopseudomonas infernalis]
MIEENSGRTEQALGRESGGRPAEDRSDPARDPNPAGPHAEPELTDKSKTPGSGMLPEPEDDATEAPSG